MSTFQVRVRRTHDETPEVRAFELVALNGDLPPFSAGGHVDVHLPGDIVRQYSLTNGPDDRDHYGLGVKREAESRGGSTAMHDGVREGDTLTISEPKNNFLLAMEARRHLLLAGGIGVTPLLSMARHLSKAGQDFAFHYFTRSPELTAFRGLIDASAWKGNATYHHGLVPPALDAVLLPLLREPADGTHLYLCGPGPFMDLVLGLTVQAGWVKDAVHLEYFTADVDPVGTDAGTFEVRLAQSGVTYPVPANKTILDVLRDNGHAVETSCEQGVCGTCETVVLEGEIDHRDLYLMEDEHEAGDRMMICVSRAKDGKLVIDR